jgi:NAD-dependent deacetylase
MITISSKISTSIQEAAELIRASKRAVVLTGAGISTPSGIPDFRSEGTGLWARFEPMEVASLNAFRYHPERFFEWMRPLIRSILEAQPNAAHLALARLGEAGVVKAVITQNIDHLHQKAGSKKVLETHGSFQTLSCGRCFTVFPSADYIDAYLGAGALPRCSHCGGILKPDVILFGEQLPQQTWQEAVKASQNCDLMMVIGSSLEVLPVASLPMQSIDRGAHLIIVNHSPTYLGVRADIVILADVAEVIPKIAEQVWS